MHDLSRSANLNNNLDREIAREHYAVLRDKLLSLKSAPEPDQAAIDAVVHELEQAQLAHKATYGLFGNNPIDDSAPQTELRANRQP